MSLSKIFIALTALLLGLMQLPVAASMGSAQAPAVQDVISAHQAELDARREFRTLSKQGLLSTQDKADYQAYINTLSRRVSASCRRLKPSQQLIDRYKLPCDIKSSQLPNASEIDHQAPTREENQSQVLNNGLNDAFGEFDELLLKEMEKLERPGGSLGGALGSGSGAIGQQSGSGQNEGQGDGQSEGSEQGENGQSAARPGTGDEQGQESGEGSQVGKAAGGAQTGNRPQGGQTGSQTGSQTGTVTGQGTTQGRGQSGRQSGQNQPQQGGSHSTGRGSVPEDIPDGRDDDIVARQLREAAEGETDPELRARLWEEYRRYKAGQ